MAITYFEFSPLDEGRMAAEDAKPIGVDDDVYDDMIAAMEKYISSVAPEMNNAKVHFEVYADAQVCQQVLRMQVWPDPIRETTDG
jgi:hypothetical protein